MGEQESSNGHVAIPEDGVDEARLELAELGRDLRDRADEVRVEVVKQLQGAAETIRKEAKDRKAKGEVREAADNLAKGLEKTANYLNSRDVEDLGEDATRVIRRNPWRFIAFIFALGIAIGIFFRREE